MCDDPTRLERLRKYLKNVIRHLVSRGHPEADAPDIAQEAMIKTWQHLNDIKPGGERAYMWAAARNTGRNHHRNGATVRRGSGLVAPLDDDTVTVDTAPSAEERLIRDQEIAAFRKKFAEALAQLPEETRFCLLLRKRGLSYDEIARKLGCTSQSARTRVSRASKLLRERVGPPPGGLKWMEISEGDDDDSQ